MKDNRGADWNFVEFAVDRLGGVKAAAKAMCVTQKTMTTWLKRGMLTDEMAKIMERKSDVAWELLAGAGKFYY